MPEAYIASIVEEIISERPHLDIHARSTFRSLLTRLLRAARPGNWAWQRLVNDFGFDPDFTPADHGDPPQGARW